MKCSILIEKAFPELSLNMAFFKDCLKLFITNLSFSSGIDLERFGPLAHVMWNKIIPIYSRVFVCFDVFFALIYLSSRPACVYLLSVAWVWTWRWWWCWWGVSCLCVSLLLCLCGGSEGSCWFGGSAGISALCVHTLFPCQGLQRERGSERVGGGLRKGWRKGAIWRWMNLVREKKTGMVG